MPRPDDSRRAFLRRTALAPVVLPLAAAVAQDARGASPTNGPVVVSTWDNRRANAAAWAVLTGGSGAVLDAVEQGVWIPEADPDDRSVGLGGRPDRDGRVTLDACIMDGRGHCGAVAALEDILHPISIARRVMETTPHVLLVGDGARRFALEQGFEAVNLLTEASEREWRQWLRENRYDPPAPNIERRDPNGRRGTGRGSDRRTLPPDQDHDTIGMLARGADGGIAGACTTSGWAYKRRGRVGDSPIIGAGLFVDDEAGAATASGHGEEMIRTAAAHTVVEAMRRGASPQDAAEEAVARIRRKMLLDPAETQAGLIALGLDGRVGISALLPGFNVAVTVTGSPAAPPVAGVVTARIAVPGGTTFIVEAPALAR